jgi:hypothetical protein
MDFVMVLMVASFLEVLTVAISAFSDEIYRKRFECGEKKESRDERESKDDASVTSQEMTTTWPIRRRPTHLGLGRFDSRV